MTPVQTTFDFGPLLVPIPGEHPTGEWLRYDAVYDDIRGMREADDPSLPQGVWKRELKRADWNGVAQRAKQALATRSKDLQLAIWLSEAWLHIGGYAGFAAGMRLVAALSRQYWDGLYPPLDVSGAPNGRVAPLAWAADKLLLPIKSVPVTAPIDEDSQPLTWADRERALYYDNLEKSHPGEATNRGGAVTYPQFLISASVTPGEWYSTLARDVAAARDAVAEVEAAVSERVGAENVPSLSPLLEPLDAIHSFANRIIAERVGSGEIAAAAAAVAAPEEVPMSLDVFPHDVPPVGRAITSRAEAFQRLREAADFLMRTEPHSPVAYLILRAVSWEHMSLPDLLAELLQSNDLAAVYALLGMDRET